MTHPDSPQHYGPEYLAGQIRVLVIAVGEVARAANVAPELDDYLTKLRRGVEKGLDEGSPLFDHHTGQVHAAKQIIGELY